MRVDLTFDLGEGVNPDIFVTKIALACANGGAIRKGEAVESEGVRVEFQGWEPPFAPFNRSATLHMPHLVAKKKEAGRAAR